MNNGRKFVFQRTDFILAQIMFLYKMHNLKIEHETHLLSFICGTAFYGFVRITPKKLGFWRAKYFMYVILKWMTLYLKNGLKTSL